MTLPTGQKQDLAPSRTAALSLPSEAIGHLETGDSADTFFGGKSGSNDSTVAPGRLELASVAQTATNTRGPIRLPCGTGGSVSPCLPQAGQALPYQGSLGYTMDPH